MASKVIRGAEAEAAEALRWRPVAADRRPAGPETVSAEKLQALEQRLAESQQEAARREQQAFEAGYRKGAAEGHQQAASQLKPVLEGLAAGLGELQAMRRRMRREAERDLVHLAVAIARRILHRELSVDPEALLGIVKAALERLEGREVERVRVHPADAELIRPYLEQAGLSERVRLIADSHLARGSLLVETAQGVLDASLESQLQEIQRGLLDRLRRQA